MKHLHSGVVELVEYPQNLMTYIAVPHPDAPLLKQAEVFLNHDTEDPYLIELYSIDTREEVREQGLASSLFDFVISHALEIGCEKIRAEAHHEQTAQLFARFRDQQLLVQQPTPSGELKRVVRGIQYAVGSLAACRAQSPSKRFTSSMLREKFIITAELAPM